MYQTGDVLLNFQEQQTNSIFIRIYHYATAYRNPPNHCISNLIWGLICEIIIQIALCELPWSLQQFILALKYFASSQDAGHQVQYLTVRQCFCVQIWTSEKRVKKREKDSSTPQCCMTLRGSCALSCVGFTTSCKPVYCICLEKIWRLRSCPHKWKPAQTRCHRHDHDGMHIFITWKLHISMAVAHS